MEEEEPCTKKHKHLVYNHFKDNIQVGLKFWVHFWILADYPKLFSEYSTVWSVILPQQFANYYNVNFILCLQFIFRFNDLEYLSDKPLLLTSLSFQGNFTIHYESS